MQMAASYGLGMSSSSSGHERCVKASGSKLGTIRVGSNEASAIWYFTAAIRHPQDLSLDSHEILNGHHMLACGQKQCCIYVSCIYNKCAYH